MVLFNYSTKELTAKVVYYGPGLCGKTTNLQWIHEKLPIKNKGKMLSLATETDRTLFFDFLPIEIGTIRGMRTRIQLYTVPGQVFYNATRRMVLKGADCLVFVCDSQEAMLDANLESFENMRQNLEANEINAEEIPIVFQYNKRDLPNALPLEIINERMNPRDQPFFEAVAVKGIGVEETLKGVTKLVFKSLSVKYGEGTGPYSRPPGPAGPQHRPPAAPPPSRLAAPAPPRPVRPRGATATIPPAAARPTMQSPEDLLDELDLEPSGDAGFEPVRSRQAQSPHHPRHRQEGSRGPASPHRHARRAGGRPRGRARWRTKRRISRRSTSTTTRWPASTASTPPPPGRPPGPGRCPAAPARAPSRGRLRSRRGAGRPADHGDRGCGAGPARGHGAGRDRARARGRPGHPQPQDRPAPAPLGACSHGDLT